MPVGSEKALMPKDRSSVKARVIQLRVEKHLSLREIHERTGVPKGTLSNWLKPYPLPEDVRQAKQAVGYEKLRDYIQSERKRIRPTESKFHKALGDQQLTHYQRGSIAEAAVLFRLALHGFRVYGALFDGGSADWLVESFNGKRLKLQVKSARIDGRGMPIIPLRCSDGRTKQRCYREGEFDFIVGYCLFSDTAYVLTFEEVRGKSWHTPQEQDEERWDKLLES